MLLKFRPGRKETMPHQSFKSAYRSIRSFINRGGGDHEVRERDHD